MLGWHFCRNDKCLGFGDGRHIRTGRTLKVKPPIVFCKRGLHASKRIIDALHYSQGSIICRVKLSGQIIYDTDKAVAAERTVLWMKNATNILNEFACLCAERALKKAKVTDERFWNAIKVKRLWLIGKATNKELDVAWEAARNAAWRAADDATNEYATKAAECAAARDASWRAAWNAEKKWQNKKLLKMIEKMIESLNS